MKKPLLVFISVLIFSFSFAQGTIRGKVSDKNGETLIGVTIVLKSNRSVGVATDLDGNYSLKISDSTAQTLLISYVSYQTVEEMVHPVKGEVIIKNFVLESASKDLGVVEIVAKASKAKEYYMENIKKNSSTTLEYVSAETMKKTGDPNVTAAIARVPGVSTNSGGFITVRGIGDRYVKTTINGSRIPTLDPFTNNIKLDLFPASLVDNVIITKTASPDFPGDWAGAYLSIETKDYPDQLSVNIESQVGYNNQTTFKEVLSSEHSKTDWLGYDNGLRDRNTTNFVRANNSPSDYEYFVALGLGNYYKSLGITDWSKGNIPASVQASYFNLGLVQLGLLAPAQINDNNAVSIATAKYNNGSYKSGAFNVINAGAVKFGQTLPDNWNTTTRKAPLDFSQSFSIGDQLKLFGRPLGFIAGFRYGSFIQYDPNSIAQRPATGYDPVKLESSKEQQITRETHGWSALVNLAYKFNPNNSVSFLFMPNLNGVNNVRTAHELLTTNDVSSISQFYEERKQMVYQFKSEHYLPHSKLKIESNASYTRGKSQAPDFKYFEYSTNVIDPDNKGLNRYYRKLSDNLFDSRLSAELPLGSKPELLRKLKFGGAFQHDVQKNDQDVFNLISSNKTTPHDHDFNSLFSLDQFEISNSTINRYYQNQYSPTDHTFGNSSVIAGFAMLDYTLFPSLRVSGGLRVEQANTHTDVDQFDYLGYQPDDIRRSYSSFKGYSLANPSAYNKLSYLPSANIIYKLRKKEDSPINLRFNFSQTVARPSIRELTNISFFDYSFSESSVVGNPNLKTVEINNYDMRLESYFKNGDNISLSLFDKDFKNHIELVYSDHITWENVNKANVKGIELEGKKKIIKHLEFRANVTLVNSTETYVRTYAASGASSEIKRAMYGQAPYIINGILSYTSDSIGLTIALSYNEQGPRLVIVSNSDNPNVYELTRHLLDFKVTKKLSKHFSVSFTARNILNAPIRRSYKFPEGYTADYDRYTYGTNYLLSVSYKL